jgi:hemerythrin-like domain-containing protein
MNQKKLGGKEMFEELIAKQHNEIKKTLRELQEDIYSVEDLSRNALWIALKIGHLNGVLAMHLKFEDDYLYPCLLQSQAKEAKAVANNVVDEMGELANEFDAYQKKYLLNPSAIRQNTEAFRQDSLQIIERILKRIEAEEKDVYSLATGTYCFRPEAYKK